MIIIGIIIILLLSAIWNELHEMNNKDKKQIDNL